MLNRQLAGGNQRGGVAVVVLIVLAVLVAAGVVLYLTGALGTFGLVLSEDGIKVEHTSAGEREDIVVGALKKFAAAQEIFRKKYGEYAPQPEILVGVGDVPAEAAVANDRITCYEGYYFYGVQKQGGGIMNKKDSFLFVAFPCEYGPGAKATYVMGKTARVFKKDVGAEPIDNSAAVDSSWKEVK